MSHIQIQEPQPPMKQMRRLLRGAFHVALALIALILTVVALAVVFGGLRFTRVLSDSMAPEFHRGDMLATISVPRESLDIGEVVLLSHPADGSDALYAHRVTSVQQTDSAVVVHTKGDANPAPDSLPLAIEAKSVPLMIGLLPMSRLPLPTTSPMLVLMASTVMLVLAGWSVMPVIRAVRTRDLRMADR